MEKSKFTVWFQCTLGACRLSQEDLSKSGPDVNSLALATATITRVRNANASAVHYRMSTIMFHSGVKHDLIRLNRFGLCMSPDDTVTTQTKMNKQLDKALIEENRCALLLARGVLRKQIVAPPVDVKVSVVLKCLRTSFAPLVLDHTRLA